MADNTINVFLTSFPGLSVPKTVSLPLPLTCTISSLLAQISETLPSSLSLKGPLVLTTTSGRRLASSEAPISTLLPENVAPLLPLRLTAPLVGGKGGFGSQLRAAGGRMSSRKKRSQGENNGSNRNLDGRRLRTITEAKNLAEYLALKPEMDAREKEERRKRWEQVVEAAERRQEELKSGASKQGKLSGQWVEDKEELGERAREAVLRAMKSGNWSDHLKTVVDEMEAEEAAQAEASGSSGGGGSGAEASEEDSDLEDATAGPVHANGGNAPVQRTYFGFDDEDEEFMSSDDEEGSEGLDGEKHAGGAAEEIETTDKGKARA